MRVEIIGSPEKQDTGPIVPMIMRITDHPRAFYSHDQLLVKILDHTDTVMAEMSIPRTELCRAVRAFEIQRYTDRGNAS